MGRLMELENIRVYFEGRDTPVLHQVSLEVRAGEWLTVTGRNGSGKSVLGKLLAGLEGRYEGSIRRPVASEPLSVQWVMQNPESQLIGETVLEDVCFGPENKGLPPGRIREAAAEALRQVGLAGLENMPVHRLSGGQKQLLALAGALAAEPVLLVADEVTSMLDPASRQRVLQVLQGIRSRGVTIVMITQMLEELAYADRVLAMDDGTIVYTGGKEAFFYGGNDGEGEPACCERLGLEPPYTVRVAKELMKRGAAVQGFPLTPDELVKAVRKG